MNNDELNLDLGKLLLHPFYLSMWTVKARYKIYNGAKDTMKSKSAALRIVTKFLAGNNRNIVVLRKYATYNTKSTLNDILWAFELLANTFNLPQLSPVTADENRTGKKRGRIIYTKQSPHTITDTITGTVIFFTGLDRLKSGGITLTHNPDHCVDTIWYEEPVEIDIEGGDLIDDSTYDKWRIAESTIIRGFRDEDPDTGESILKKGFEWVEPEIIFTHNSHDPDHWLQKDFSDKFIPINITDKKDIKRMETEKVRIYNDPNYQGGDGLFICRTTQFLNPGRDRNWITQMKVDSYETYCYLVCSATRPIGGRAYEGHINNLITEPVKRDEVWPLSCGIDHANSPTHGDWFVGEFLGTTVKDSLQDLAGEPTFERKIFFSEVKWNNKEMDFKDDDSLAELVVERLFSMVKNNIIWKARIIKLGFAFVVDWNAVSFMQSLSNVIGRYRETHYKESWLYSLQVIPVKGKNSMIWVQELKKSVNARLGRVYKNRAFLDNRMLHIDKLACPMFYREFSMTSLKKKNGDQVEVIDQNRDSVDAGDYSWMVDPFNEYFDNALHKKQSMRKSSYEEE